MFKLRRGIKKVWVAVFFLSVLMVSGAILETMKYARDVHAQTELTTEDVRVKYFEWADTAEWYLGYGYAVTESGELYYSTDILKAPFKRVYFANGEPLKNIKKVSTQNYLNMRGSGNIFVFALTEDGTIYVKGSNVNNVFADTNISNSSTFIPLSYEFNSPVKDVKVGARNAYVLLENGEVYASGSAVGGGLGNADLEIGTGFTKVAVERIKQIEANHYNAYALDEDGAVWAWGHIPYGRNDNVWDSNTPTKMKNSDGTDFDIPVKYLGNASMSQEIMGGIDGIGLVFMGEDKKIYYVQNRGTSGINVGPITYTPKEIVAEYPELTGNITNLTYGMHNLSLVDNQTYYIMYSSGLAGENKFDQTSNARDAVNKVIPYQSTAAGVDASVPVLSAAETYGHTYIIKSENKKLYIKGIPAKYVLDLEIKAKKTTDNTEYRSEEKYNRDIQFSFQVAQQDQSSIRYKIADLPDGTYGEEQVISNYNNFPISVAEGEHIHRTYRAYIAGNEASYTTSYTVDLYKKSFANVSISNNGTYAINKEITFDATNGLEGNQVEATLTNAEGTSTTISSGHSITVEGSYHLTLKDSYGNQYDADFVIAPAAQGITFTPSETLVYGSNVTTAGARMGTLSLVYGEGLPQLSIAEASITGGDEQGYFTIDMDTTSNTTYIKAAQNVPAGEYSLTIAGKDEEDVDFEYSVTFVVAKANVTLLWSDVTLAAEQAGLHFNDEFQASVANAPEGVTITYGLVEAVEGVTVNEDGTLQFGDITQDEVTIKIKAEPSASDNYTMETITLELTIRKEALSLKTVIQDGDTTANQYEITLGDALPIFHVEQSASVLTNVPQPDSYQLYNANDEAVDAITQAGVYTIKPVYRQLPTEFGLYDITWSYAQLQVGELVIDETNASQFYSLIIDDGNDTSYTIGEWTNKDIIIKQAHPVFDRIRVGEGEASTSNYRYHVNGSQDVALSFCNAENACVQTSVELKYDAAAPEISSFTYAEINTSAFSSFLRMVTFDRYFRNAQVVSFHGSDEHSGIEGYRYELMNLDEEGNAVESTLVEDTISSTDTIELATNASYRIRAWAIDKAGNESGEKIERVYLNDQVAELEITATSNEQPYLGNTWTAQSIGIDLSSSSTIEVEYYEYSSDGQEFTRMSGNHIDIPNPLTNVNGVTYYFRGHLVDGSICEGSIVVKVDTIKPIISIQAASNDEPYEEGALAHHTIVLTPTQEAENISGVRYYYTTDESASTGDPRSVQGWIEVNGAIEHTTNGETTYYVKAVSGAGLVSDPVSFDVSLRKLEYNAVSLRTTSEEESYVQGSWAKGDVTFQLSGGIIDETLITGYEYTTTDGDTAPTSQAQWQRTNQASGHRIEETTMNKTYWFRPLPWSDEGQISQGVKVNLDVEVPSVPLITLSEVNTNMLARFLHEISFHNWFPYEVQATLLAEDAQSGIDHYEIEEVVGGETTTRHSQDGVLRYGEDTEVVLRTRACDRAGNCSELSASEAIQIDLHAPMITGVEDTKTYVYYHRPRQIHVNDIGSGIAESTLQKPDGSIITMHEQEEIIQAGDYTIYAKDIAGNEITIRFTIRNLPGFDGLNGSDASYNIIANMIEEARQAEQDDINQSEYRDWINEAERIWKQYRVPSIVADDESGKIDSIQDTGFDPSLKLVVEKIEEDEIPQLPRKALYVYDVYLKKGNTVVQANGDVKVYLPYTHEDAPIIYQIDKDTNEVTQIPSQREGEYVTFTVSDLMKYAISNTAQELQRTEACTVGPDGNSNTNDDVCGIANDQGQEAIRNEDGSVDVPENGSIHFPNDIIIQAPDGAHIYPDGSVLLPDGTEYNPDGSKKEVNNDSNQDGIPDINIDIDCDGIADINIDTDGDRKPDINIDTTGDGLPNYNVDIRNRNGELYPDGIPDINIGPVDWKETDVCKTTDCGKQYCTSSYYKPYLNIDTDQDQLPDVNVDLDGDQEADINIDTDFDFIPNINIDTTGNGKPDINIDHDGDGKADENLLHVSEWKPTKNVKHGIEYDTMPNLKPDPALNPEDNDKDSAKNPDDSSKKPDQTANDGNSTSTDKTSSNTSVKGNYQNNAGMGGANTGIQDFTTYYAVLCLFLVSFMSVCIYRYRKH